MVGCYRPKELPLFPMKDAALNRDKIRILFVMNVRGWLPRLERAVSSVA